MIEFNCRKDILSDFYLKFLEGYNENLGYYSYDFKVDTSDITDSIINRVAYVDDYLYTTSSVTVGNYYNDNLLRATYFYDRML